MDSSTLLAFVRSVYSGARKFLAVAWPVLVSAAALAAKYAAGIASEAPTVFAAVVSSIAALYHAAHAQTLSERLKHFLGD